MSHPVVRWQIVTPAPAKESAFYRSLFGWDANRDNQLDYEMIDTCSEKGIQGGIWPAPPEAPTFTQLYVEVEDCAAYVRRAVELGATVIVPVQKLPDGDRMAVLQDPCGMAFGIVESAGA